MEKSPKLAKIFSCELCDYKCCKKSDYEKHILTLKHQNRTNSNNLEQNVAKNHLQFICKKCSKIYTARNSLWYHEKNVKKLILILLIPILLIKNSL
jgi:hypothetical protein